MTASSPDSPSVRLPVSVAARSTGSSGTETSSTAGELRQILVGIPCGVVLPWWHRMLADRERTLLDAARSCEVNSADASDPSHAAIEAYRAVADRLGSELIAVAAESLVDPVARAIVDGLATVSALEALERCAGWYVAQGLMSQGLAGAVTQTLRSSYTALAPQMATVVAASTSAGLEVPPGGDWACGPGEHTGWPQRCGSESAESLEVRR